jgi:hypothetical protein
MTLAADLTYVEHGYDKWFTPFDHNVKVVASGLREVPMFLTAEVSYIFERGLSYLGYLVADVMGFLQGANWLVGPETMEVSQLKILTSAWDFKTENMKTLHAISVRFGNIAGAEKTQVYARVHYRTEQGSDWRITRIVAVDTRGEARFNVSGIDFRVELFTDEDGYADVRIDDVIVHYDAAATNYRAVSRRR